MLGLKLKDNPPHKERLESTLCPPRTHNPRFGKVPVVGVLVFEPWSEGVGVALALPVVVGEEVAVAVGVVVEEVVVVVGLTGVVVGVLVVVVLWKALNTFKFSKPTWVKIIGLLRQWSFGEEFWSEVWYYLLVPRLIGLLSFWCRVGN